MPRSILTGILVVILAAGLGACRKEEQNRPLNHEKGKYSGPADSQLSEDQLRTLRNRMRNQAAGGI